MTKNEIVLRLRDAGIDASYTDRSASVFVEDYTELSAVPGWFAFRVVCENGETEEKVASVLSKSYSIRRDEKIWRLKSRGGRIVGGRKKTPTPAPTIYYTVEAFGTGGFVEGTGTYPAGSVITLTANPYDGWVFDRWDDGTTDPEKTVTVTEDMVFEAYFVPEY